MCLILFMFFIVVISYPYSLYLMNVNNVMLHFSFLYIRKNCGIYGNGKMLIRKYNIKKCKMMKNLYRIVSYRRIIKPFCKFKILALFFTA